MKIVVIGNGKMAADCIRWMLANENHTVEHVFFENEKNVSPRVLLDLIEEQKVASSAINKIHDPIHLDLMNAIAPDWIFNINCYQYLRESVLTIPQRGVINFHNGPLPRYGGVNIPSWAIINGEQQHGVTWHLVTSEIDAGAILSQDHFEISNKMTAAQLMVKCIQVGLQLFERHWTDWVEGNVQPIPQNGERLYFGLKDKVPNGGLLTKNQSTVEWDKIIRGLHLFPYPNDFGFAHLFIQQKKYIVISAKKINDLSDAQLGSIRLYENKKLLIQLSDGQFVIDQMASWDFKLIQPSSVWPELGRDQFIIHLDL